MNDVYDFETPHLFSNRRYGSDEQAVQEICREFPRALFIYVEVERGKMRVVWEKT